MRINYLNMHITAQQYVIITAVMNYRNFTLTQMEYLIWQ